MECKTKVLGILINNKLTWNDYTTMIKTKLS